MKRIFLFIITNLAVIFVLNLTLRLFGINHLFSSGTLYSLLIFALLVGMGGAIFSLAISKWSAKAMTNAQVIEQPTTEVEHWLIATVQRQATAAQIGMPEVAIYNSPDLNAFATGMNQNNALVAVSTGLLEGMKAEEVEAVLAHEISHVANGDMVTLTLIQGVVNTFVIFLSRIIGHLVDRMVFKNARGSGVGYLVTSMLAELVMGVLASIIVLWFSRQREFQADAGAAKLAGAENMIRALQRLQQAQNGTLTDQLAAFGIHRSQSKSLIRYLFLTHPPLPDRIEALQKYLPTPAKNL